MSEVRPQPGMVAFWGYDTFPFILSGVVEEVLPNGVCRLGGGWGGATIRPDVVLPAHEGQAIAQLLQQLRVEHRQAVMKTNMAFNAKVAAIAPFVPNNLKVRGL